MGKRRHSSHEGTDDRRTKHSKKAHADDDATTAKDAIDAKATKASSKHSAFRKIQFELTVSILPSGLEDVSKTVQESLQHFLLKYSSGMKGVPLAFNSVKILKNGSGNILNELPHIHYSVACDAVVFAPKQGQRLTGVVRESFHSHLSLVVYNYFNASVSADALREQGFTFDLEDEQWKTDDDESLALSVDDRIRFKVLKVHESAGIISIEGEHPKRMDAS
ncbi:hypothetical protein MPSEU_001061800 [Mayamaea pseudoterrestris]|nr:hypothetical protein MPSEU_001061800 [Mayamaea pseudoterrestris]